MAAHSRPGASSSLTHGGIRRLGLQERPGPLNPGDALTGGWATKLGQLFPLEPASESAEVSSRASSS